MGLYLLDVNRNPVPINDVMTWATGKMNMNTTVARDEIRGILISTVFLGVDHNFLNHGPPVLWETMIFDSDVKTNIRRYSSYEDALIGHQQALELVLETLHGARK